jgi:hypothetical protein
MRKTELARAARALALAALLAAAAAPAGGVSPEAGGQGAESTMTNDSLATAAPPPLPEGWPSGARDAQFRGAACETAYGAPAARAKATPGDDVVPVVARPIPGMPAPYVAVRRLPFLTRRDVLAALYAPSADGTYEVTLKLTEDGAAKIQEYTKAHESECIALVAGGKVVFHPTLTTPVADDTFVLSGSFTVTEAQSIVEMFAR